MDAEILKDADILFQNRQRFIRFNQFKIDRALSILSEDHRLIFITIPRLLHVNQPGLPGYFSEKVPCGIKNYRLTAETRVASETLFPNLILRRNENLDPVIHSVLLMGSVGSIAQTEKSDLDFTLLVDNESFTEESLALFRRKLRLIEEWAWNEFHMETHFFINDWREVRNNMFGESDSESTGSALAKLLKEEMFRTLIILAGKIPFWWITPVETDDARYDTLLQRVHSGQTLLNREEFIDIGNVDDISNGEFFGGSIWTLIKSFQSPFKTIMKMGLLEDYMFGETRFNLLCHGIKKKVFSDKTFSDIDPYFSLFERVQEFFQQTKSENDLDTLRAAFYLKVGTQVTPQELEAGSQDYKKSILIHLIRSWGWNAYKLKQLNQYTDWQMMQKVAMGNRVNKILMSSYKNISEKNKSLDSQESLITQKDTHLLGRKLFSFYRRAPNKVENLFALADGNTAERELTFLLEQEKPRERPTWYLIRGRTLTFIEHVNPENIIKKAATLPFLIAFTAFNKLFRSETELLIRAEGQSCKESDLRILLNQLTSFISQINIATISNEDLLCEARINKLYLIIDFGNPIPREIVYGNINDCKSNEELTQFINKRVERIKNLTAIYLTSWGELFCKTYAGLNCMGRFLSELSPQISAPHLEDRNFLKVYIPSGRKEILQIPWLNSYLIRSLRIRGKTFIDKAAS